MDGVDLRIIEVLSKDSRTSFLEIARKIGVTEGTVRRRVGLLKQSGCIKKFSLELGGQASQVKALVAVKTDSHRPTAGVVNLLSKIKGVQRVFEVSGAFDIFLIVSAQSLSGLNSLVETVRQVRGVSSSESFTVLSEEG